MGSNRWVLGVAILAAVAGLAAVVATHIPSSSPRSAPATVSRGLDRKPNLLARPGAAQPLALLPPASEQAAPEQQEPSFRAPFFWPVGGVITQEMHPGEHWGIDIGAPIGTPVRAVADGQVLFAGGDPCCGYGLYAIVQHEGGWASLYAHFSKMAVQPGDGVLQGQVIGRIGVTGKTTGPHLHFELRLEGMPVDPLRYLPSDRNVPVIGDVDIEEPAPAATPSQPPTDAPFNLPLVPVPERPTDTIVGLLDSEVLPAQLSPTPSPPDGTPSPTAAPDDVTPTEEPSPAPPATKDATPTPEPGTPTAEATATPEFTPTQEPKLTPAP